MTDEGVSGKIIIAIAIIIAGILIAQAITTGSMNVNSGLDRIAELIRDGLLQLGSVS